jgi:hypothetical protein
MTWTELVAFWVTFAITFVAFISWFNLDTRLEKPFEQIQCGSAMGDTTEKNARRA